MTVLRCLVCGDFIRRQPLTGCSRCGTVFHSGCVSGSSPCGQCGGDLVVGEAPPATGAYRLDDELRALVSLDARLAVIDTRWAEGTISSGEYWHLLSVAQDEARGPYDRTSVAASLASDDDGLAGDALIDASIRDPDTAWVEQASVRTAHRTGERARLAAARAVQYLATRTAR